MRSRFFFILCFLLIAYPCYAQPSGAPTGQGVVSFTDGTNTTYPWQVKTEGGIVTDNGDGTANISFAGGSGTPGGNNTEVQVNVDNTSFAGVPNGAGYLKNDGAGVYSYDNPAGTGNVTAEGLTLDQIIYGLNATGVDSSANLTYNDTIQLLTLTGNQTMSNATWLGTGSTTSRIDFTNQTAMSIMGASVGIGTTNPDTKFHINGTGEIISTVESADDRTSLLLKAGGVGNIGWLLMSGFPAAGDFNIREYGVANYFTIKKTTGYVGVGTVLPTCLLDVNGTVNMTAGNIGAFPIVHNGTAFTGDVTGNITATVVGDDSHAHTTTTISGLNLFNDVTDFPVDPNADRFLMWDDNPGILVWSAGGGGEATTVSNTSTLNLTLTGADITGDVTILKDLVTTAPLAGGTNDILPGADSDVTLSIADADDDDTTKGACTFNDTDFNVVSGLVTIVDDGHAHTTTSISGLDISADTNLSVTAPIVLTDDNVSITMLGDLATTAPITGAANDIFPGATGAKATIAITVLKDIVAGVGLSGGENDVLPGADADTTLTFAPEELESVTWGGGGAATIVHTYNVSGTDTTMTMNSALTTFSGSITSTLDLNVNGDDIQLGATGVKITDDTDGAITFLGSSAGADEDLRINLDDTANVVVMDSSTLATELDWLGTSGSAALFGLGSTGVLFQDDADGALTITGRSAGYDESLTFNFDDVENTVGITSGSGVTGITFDMNLILNENKSIVLDPAIGTDHQWCGITEAGTAGATIAIGDLCSLHTDGEWYLVDANTAHDSSGDARRKLGIAVTTGADAGAVTMLLYGKIRHDAFADTLLIGDTVYASETAGAVTVTQPTTTDVVIRVIGFGNTADELFFCPSPDYITHT